MSIFILKEYAYLQHSFCLYSWVVHKVTPYQYPWDGISNVQSNDTPNGHGNPFFDANCCCCCFGIKIAGNLITFVAYSMCSIINIFGANTLFLGPPIDPPLYMYSNKNYA